MNLCFKGDEGDFFYSLEKGTCDVFIESEDNRKKVAVITEGGTFGELALIHNQPRAATVIVRNFLS